MKQIMKKAASVCTALLCAASLTFAGTALVFADEVDAALETQLITTCEGLTETIIPLTEEEITAYKSSGDDFTEAAMTAWEISKDELGAYVAIKSSDVEFDGDTYTVTVNADFETVDAEFVYVFDEQYNPTSMTVNPLYSFATNMQRAGLNTAMGMGIVFSVLVFLSLLISLFKYIPMLLEIGKKKEAAPAAAEPVAAPAPVVEEVTDDTELIAVIAAAIAAAEGTTTDGFVVRSIRKVNRRKW